MVVTTAHATTKTIPAIHIFKTSSTSPTTPAAIPRTQSTRRTSLSASASDFPLATSVHFKIVPPSTIGTGIRLMVNINPCPTADQVASSRTMEPLEAIPYTPRLKSSSSKLKISPPDAAQPVHVWRNIVIPIECARHFLGQQDFIHRRFGIPGAENVPDRMPKVRKRQKDRRSETDQQTGPEPHVPDANTIPSQVMPPQSIAR